MRGKESKKFFIHKPDYEVFDSPHSITNTQNDV